MSSYVVDDKVINEVVSKLRLTVQGPYSYKLDWTQIVKSYNGLGSRKDCEKLAHDMFNLNVEAVNQRYGEGQAEQFRPLDFAYKFNVHAGPISALKALESWLYQCNEGNVHETELYKMAEELRAAIAINIVHGLDQYEKSPW